MRAALTTLLRLGMRLFFRRIEMVGVERVPLDVPVIFAANHPNGLVDPLFFICFAPRRVSLLAKAPLFRYPLIGYLVRALDSIPVYRKQDHTKGTNEETFGRAREILRSGGSIAIFPEGTTHSDSQLRELKTGAARIALGARLPALVIVPAGIYYTAKQTFRSEALVWFGEPVPLPGGSGEEEPSPQAVRELTAQIEQKLDAVTLQADSHAALELIARAEEIFSGQEERPLAAEFELRRRFIDGYHALRAQDPDRLERLSSSVRQFLSELGRARLQPEGLSPRLDLGPLLPALLLVPLALAGAVVHFLPYRIIDLMARRLSRNEDELTATIKFVSALLLYPLTWTACSMAAWRMAGPWASLITVVALPLLGYAALWELERLDELRGTLRALLYRRRRRSSYQRLLAGRQWIHDQILAVADGMDRGPSSQRSGSGALGSRGTIGGGHERSQ